MRLWGLASSALDKSMVFKSIKSVIMLVGCKMLLAWGLAICSYFWLYAQLIEI